MRPRTGKMVVRLSAFRSYLKYEGYMTGESKRVYHLAGLGQARLSFVSFASFEALRWAWPNDARRDATFLFAQTYFRLIFLVYLCS